MMRPASDSRQLQAQLRSWAARLRTTKDASGRTPIACIENIINELDQTASQVDTRSAAPIWCHSVIDLGKGCSIELEAES